MKKVLIFLILFNFTFTNIYADNKYFLEGVKLFEKKEFDNAKFKFEQDIVFNPKNEHSYLYLAKIFKSKDKDNLTEQNLDTVILLNPQNEEALYEMIILKINHHFKKPNIKPKNLFINPSDKLSIALCTNLNKKNNII